MVQPRVPSLATPSPVTGAHRNVTTMNVSEPADPTPIAIPFPGGDGYGTSTTQPAAYTPAAGLRAPSPTDLIAPADPLQDVGPEPESDTPKRWNWIDWLAVVVLVAASLVLVGLHVRRYTQLSPIDELQHLDYAAKAAYLEIPRPNERVGDIAMNEAACRDVDAPQYIGPPCGLSTYDPGDFQEAGVNTAATQFPVYYVITGLIARAVVSIGAVSSFLVAARMVGALWLGAGFALLWYAFAVIGLSRLARAAVLSVYVATPLLLFHASTVNADAALFFCGALMMLATIKYTAGEWPWWTLVPVMVFIYAIEPTNTLIIAASLVFMFFDAIRRKTSILTVLFPIVALIVVAVVRWRYGAWLHRQLWPKVASQVQAPMFENREPVSLRPEMLANQVPATFMPVSNVYLPPFMRDGFTNLTISLTNWLTIALASITSLIGRSGARLTALGRIVMLACLVAGPLYSYYYATFSDVFYPAAGRFALPLVAAIIIVAGAALLNRFVIVVTLVVGLSVIANALWHLAV